MLTVTAKHNTRSEQYKGAVVNFWRGVDTFAIYRQNICLHAYGGQSVRYAALAVAVSVLIEESKPATEIPYKISTLPLPF